MSSKRKILSLLLGLITCILALLMTHLQSESESSFDTTVFKTERLIKKISVSNSFTESSPWLLNQALKFIP